MEYFARIALEHQGILEMIQVQRELNERMKKAKGVNIVHLDNLLLFWRDFLAQEHMSWEEEFAFAALRKLNHGLPDRLQGDHDRIKTALAKLEATIKPLRGGRPHSGREYLRWSEELTETVGDHLARENAALQRLAEEGAAEEELDLPPERGRGDRVVQLVQVADELCQEYLQKPTALLPLAEKLMAVEETERLNPGPERLAAEDEGLEEGPSETETSSLG